MFVFDLKVSIIEPGFMKTPIIEGHLQEQEKLWQNLSIEIKERWGESYAKNSIIPQAENFFVKYAENPSKVIRVIQHAVSSRKPMIRYRPGWQSSFLVFALEFLIPTRLTDFILQLIYFSGERPAAVNRQLAKD
ncbi:unnamed protein product [Didymodactylos carnosus]|nr:unnamed protein product [Didymodactylos carnosus]CAF3609507.1 unnamed protein product [Didymodactylos carnosus]